MSTARVFPPIGLWLVLGHRWLGIAVCLLFVPWFVSGVVMMYVGFPALTTDERLAGLEPIDWRGVRITPDEAMQRLDLARYPNDLRVQMMTGEPVYRIVERNGARHTVSARDGQVIDRVDAAHAVAIAGRFSGGQARLDATIIRDQWTVAGGYDPHRPLHRVSILDDAGTRLYVSSSTGEVVLDTARRERAWNRVGAVIHWIYFTELRTNQRLWRQLVLWLAGIGIVVAATGLWLGVLRLRRWRYRTGLSPYRGWMAWHHWTGLIGGVVLLTWVFSGWLSLSPPVPWGGSASRVDLDAYAGNTAATFGADRGVLQRLAAVDAREAAFVWLAGNPQIVVADSAGRETVLHGRDGTPITFGDDELFDNARAALPAAGMVAATRLTEEDAYWYSHHNERRLPVLRAVFDDDAGTWLHIDPDTGRVLAVSTRSRRINRWLFNGLHSLDFRWLLLHRPLWDIVVWLLSAVGVAISVTGVVIGWRRLRRNAVAAQASPQARPARTLGDRV